MIQSASRADLFTQWDIPWAVTSTLTLTAVLYLRGWILLRRTRPSQLTAKHLTAFLGGIFALFVAVASPLDTFSESLLFMHMAQHFVLMSVAPPLIVYGAPMVPMLRGLPRFVIRRILRPLFVSHMLPEAASFCIRPRVAWIAMNVAFIAWHVPRAYEFALSSENWHNVEHACFFFTNLLFWWPVLRPWPTRKMQASWVLIPYLLLADIINTGISAFLCFSGRLLYPSYGQIARPFGFDALNDQIAAGAFMWVCGSIVYLIPAIAIVAQILSSRTVPLRQSN